MSKYNLGELIVEKKSCDIDGKSVNYFDCYVTLKDGCVLKFSPKKEYKGLLFYLVK